jgi:hypothetical protein
MRNQKKFNKGDDKAHWDLVTKEYIGPILGHIRKTSIFQKQPPDQYVKMYGQVQSLCDAGDDFCKFFLDSYKGVLQSYVTNDVVPALQRFLDQGAVLNGLIEYWENYALLSYMMKRMFSYLDRFYLRQSKKLG